MNFQYGGQRKFVDSVNSSPMVPVGDHCSVGSSERPSRSWTGFLAISDSLSFSAMGQQRMIKTFPAMV